LTTPGGKPEIEPEGLNPRSPLSVVERVLVTPVLPKTEKLPAEPRSMVGTDAEAGEVIARESNEPMRRAKLAVFVPT